MGNDDTDIYHGALLDETPMAIKFKPLEDYLDPVWIPKSQIAMTRLAGKNVKVEMPIWLARKKGLY